MPAESIVFVGTVLPADGADRGVVSAPVGAERGEKDPQPAKVDPVRPNQPVALWYVAMRPAMPSDVLAQGIRPTFWPLNSSAERAHKNASTHSAIG